MIRTLLIVGFGMSLATGLVGCGDTETLYDVSGTITFEGKPIPKGMIYFDPDKGSLGKQGYANIENGKFDTSLPMKGRGIRGGPYIIRIGGFTGKEAPESPWGQALFPEHQFAKELPAQKQTLDYDVKKR